MGLFSDMTTKTQGYRWLNDMIVEIENEREQNINTGDRQLTIPDVVDSACICEENAKGRAISGYCNKNKTDWA